jgi:hypothetical protein
MATGSRVTSEPTGEDGCDVARRILPQLNKVALHLCLSAGGAEILRDLNMPLDEMLLATCLCQVAGSDTMRP